MRELLVYSNLASPELQVISGFDHTSTAKTGLDADLVILELDGLSADDLSVFDMASNERGDCGILVLVKQLDAENVDYWTSRGADDVVAISDLNPAFFDDVIRHVSERYRLKSRLDQMANDTAGRESQLYHIFNRLSDGILGLDAERKIRFANQSAKVILGGGNGFLGSECPFHVQENETTEIELDPEIGPAVAEVRTVKTTWKGEILFLVSIRDITKRKQLMVELARYQKKQAIGQLAAGIAHEFNNILAVLRLTTEMLLRRSDSGIEVKTSLKSIDLGCVRAGELVKHLQTFSQQRTSKPKLMELNALSWELKEEIRELMGEAIELELINVDEEVLVMADHELLRDAIMKIVENARDAMAQEGHFILGIGIDEAAKPEGRIASRHHGRRFACITLSDSGAGMDSDLRKKIFDPFFTTKGPEGGTGLGLSTVQGILEEHEGWIEVDSELEKGTEVRFYIPTAEDPILAAENRALQAGYEIQGGTGHGEAVLIVEDEEELRGVVRFFLTAEGFNVYEAASAEEALNLWEKHIKDIRVVFTDVVMAGISGLEMAQIMRRRNPNCKVIITSGYTKSLLGRDFTRQEGLIYVPKPFAPSEISSMIRDLIRSE